MKYFIVPLSFVLFAIGGCTKLRSPVPDRALPPFPEFSETSGNESEASQAAGPWWLVFGDAALQDLIDQGLAQNLTIRQQWARLGQSQALADQARAGRFPQIRATGSVGWSRSVGAFGSSTGQNASVSVPVSYELDVFARAARTHQAASLEAEATREDVDAMALTMSAQIAEAWYDVVSTRAREALLRQQAELDATYLELVTLRFREGLASSVDVHQQRLQAARSASQIELTELQRELFEQQLALLVGRTRAELSLPEGATLPELGVAPAPGASADLIERRPDVRAAQRRVEASDRRIAAAVAARMPSIRLNVTPGYSWNRNEFGDDSPLGGDARTASGFTLSAGASIDVPLFDGFAGRSAVRAQESGQQLLIEAFHQVILQALFEVESAIRQEHHQARNLELLNTQATIADDTLEAAQARFRAGLSDYLPVLTALQARHGLRLQLQDAERQVVSSRIQLHRALGGPWTAEPPEPSRLSDNEEGDES
ncbi:MAG: NodT family efflux transporter outer membrane factor (OMF) lipoprotein [Polyangiales bacterium]|jgi:NodT family efflux transporter outer membrane factor (OMF) lipoprotein